MYNILDNHEEEFLMYYNLLEEQAQMSQGGGSLMMIISLVVMFGAMWLFIIRPQKKKCVTTFRLVMKSLQSAASISELFLLKKTA